MKTKYILLTVISIVGVILDQLTKIWALGLKNRPPVEVVENFFNLIYVENRGAAWGVLSTLEDSLRIPFFIVISLVAIGFIGFFFYKVHESQKLLLISISLVISGALGNFIDRLHQNFVIDFVDWHYYQYHWPTFNIADVLISVGVGLMILETVFGKSELSLFGPAAVATTEKKAPEVQNS